VIADDLENKKTALHRIKGMLRHGSARDMAESDGVPQYHDRPETDKEDARVALRVMPDHDVGDVPDQASRHTGQNADGGPRASEHSRASGPSSTAHSSPTEQEKPGNHGPGWAEGDHGHGASELRARAEGAGRSALPAGRGPPTGHTNPSSPSESTKPGDKGPGWTEDYPQGVSQVKAREEGAHRSADGEPGEESMDKDLVAGLVHIAKKYRAP
jgi:hypothetical protein